MAFFLANLRPVPPPCSFDLIWSPIMCSLERVDPDSARKGAEAIPVVGEVSVREQRSGDDIGEKREKDEGNEGNHGGYT